MNPKPFGNRAELHPTATGVSKMCEETEAGEGFFDPGFVLSTQTGLCGLWGFATNLFTQQKCAWLCRAGIQSCCSGERSSSKATTQDPKSQFDSSSQTGNAGGSDVEQSDPVQAGAAESKGMSTILWELFIHFTSAEGQGCKDQPKSC